MIEGIETKSKTSNLILKNVTWSVLGKIVNVANSLFVGILVARYLGVEKYGLMNYIISYVSLFHIIGTFGLSYIEVRELSRDQNNKESILGTCFFLRFVFSSVAYLFIVVSLIFNKEDFFTSLMILLYGLTTYTSCCFEVIRNYFISIVNNESIIKSEIFRTLIGAFLRLL